MKKANNPTKTTLDWNLSDVKPIGNFSKNVHIGLIRDNKPKKFLEKAGREVVYRLHYPDLIAKSDNGLEAIDRSNLKPIRYNRHNSEPSGWLPSCSFSFLSTICKEKHRITKLLMCGREWCPECGAKDSIYHKRRMSALTPRVRQITEVSKLGYMVVTLPIEVREKFMTQYDLNEFRRYIRRKLIREGYCGEKIKHGFIRWHFAGDCKKCKGKKCASCNHTGSDHTYHPHLNILFNCKGFINKDQFKTYNDKFRSDIEQWLSKKTKINCTGKGNINYSFAKSENEEKHIVKYVTRATWRFYNEKICTIIKNYRVGIVFGKFEKIEPKTIDEGIENRCCPVCLKNDGVINKLSKEVHNGIRLKNSFNWNLQQEIRPGVYFQYKQLRT